MVKALDKFLRFDKATKRRTILRTDSGFGSDDNVNYVLGKGWQVLTKSSGGRRPTAFARKIAPGDWFELRPDDRWVAKAVKPAEYVKPVQHLVLRWRTQKGDLKHSTVVCSVLEWSMARVMEYYDDRGACETEIQADKGGLKLCKRRKKRLAAQEAIVLLTDLAHNILAWTSHRMFPDDHPLAGFGTTRLIEDALAIPGHLIFDRERLVEVQLNERHPHASQMADGLERLLRHFDNP